jgi:hypothetical protein
MDFAAIQLAADKAVLEKWVETLRREGLLIAAENLSPGTGLRMLDFASLLERTIARL